MRDAWRILGVNGILNIEMLQADSGKSGWLQRLSFEEKIMRFLIVVSVLVLASVCGAAEGRHRPAYHGSYHHGPYYHGSYRCGPYFPYVSSAFVGVASVYTSGYYETRNETVMVAPERVERHWVAPVFVTKYDSAGKPYSEKVSEGYYQDVVIPARYETQTVRVWVSGLPAPVYAAPAPVVVGGGAFYSGRHVSVGVGFGF